MFPYINEFFYDKGISNYGILLAAGIITAVICFWIFAKEMNVDAYNFYLLIAILSVAAGLFSAFFFQAIYNYAESDKFELKGMTVMGGILGAAVFFILVVFIVTRTELGKKYKPSFWTAVNLLVPCIVIAQCIGRLGCFTAGCCYGKETDGPLGIIFIRGYNSEGKAVMHDNPRLPTQLFESVFLLLLFIAMTLVILKFKKKNVAALIYLYAYPVFRFLIEYLRDDPRGASLLGMSPSQVQSVGLLLLGIALTILIYRFKIIPFGGQRKTVANLPGDRPAENTLDETKSAKNSPK